MGCNCGKRQGAAQPRRVGTSSGTGTYALVASDGSREEFGSRLEADAANARGGYTGIVKPTGA